MRRYLVYREIPLALIIKKDMKARGLSQVQLAQTLHISKSTLFRIWTGRRSFSLSECKAIDKTFGYEKDFCENVQSYQMRVGKSKRGMAEYLLPPPPDIRKCVFWDVDMTTIDWITHKKFIIKRINSYGNAHERKAISNYYTTLASFSGL